MAARWRSRATHQGRWALRKRQGGGIHGDIRLPHRGGKIAQSWTVEDQLGLMAQIGAIPEPGQSEEASPT